MPAATGLKPMGPPQTQHTSFEVKSSSSYQPQSPLRYAEQSLPNPLVAPPSWSMHSGADGGPGADGGLNPPPQTQHISIEVKSSSS